MIKLKELKPGDIIQVDFEGQRRIGDITDVSLGDKKVRVCHGDQDYWYDFHDCYAIPLDDQQLIELGFHTIQVGKGGDKAWEKGPFTMKMDLKKPDEHTLLHYRDETRHVHAPEIRFVHQLQHHYKGMTNFGLTWPR